MWVYRMRIACVSTEVAAYSAAATIRARSAASRGPMSPPTTSARYRLIARLSPSTSPSCSITGTAPSGLSARNSGLRVCHTPGARSAR